MREIFPLCGTAPNSPGHRHCPSMVSATPGWTMKTTFVFLAVLLLSGAALAQEKKPLIPSDAAARARTPEQQAILDASTAELKREMQLLGVAELRPPKNA